MKLDRLDRRRPCYLFLSCIGAGPKYFLQLSEGFRQQYRIVPYLYNNVALLPEMLAEIERELAEGDPLLIYHSADWLPYLGKYREVYDRFVESVPARITKISIPQPGFAPFWPFHCGDPRNAELNRPLNRYGKLPCYPYGDSYVLRLMKQGLPAEEILSRYLAADLAKEIDLDKRLQQAMGMLERQDSTGQVKVADFIYGNFRSKELFQTVNHAANRLLLYMSNRVLELLGCDSVPESAIAGITEIVERPMPIHPSIARHFCVGYIDQNTRYAIDEIRNPTFAEFIADYISYAEGLINYRDALLNDPSAQFCPVDRAAR